MKASRLLAENVIALLKLKGMSQHDLAVWCRKSDPWVSQFLKGIRNWGVEDLDRVADGLTVATYQLFQPGISRITERRYGERRKGKERRISHAQRLLHETAAEVDRVRHVPAPRGLNAKLESDERRLIEHLRAHPDDKPGVFKSLELHADLQKPKPAAAKPDIGKRKRS